MIPFHDENAVRPAVPFINYGLILINFVAFFVELSQPTQQALNDFLARYAVIPADISSGHNLYTLITSQFLHGGWMHILGNMLYLWIFGDNVEGALGHIKYLIFYLGAGIIAGLAQVIIDPGSTVPSLGASGAIAGVLGAYLVMFPHARVNTLIFVGIFFFFTRLTAVIVIGFWAVLQFFSGFAEISQRTAQTGDGGVAYWAHIGGFITGVIVGFAVNQLVRPNRANWGGVDNYRTRY
ncbi:MAG TPA: rhomboid family intramembrane serine protease [Chloroflexia bacterium]|nr:rhomboid family intramembrane serine protease [Chloroflexia bacterium]